MALQAGRVGVKKDQVDWQGNIIGGGGGTDLTPRVIALENEIKDKVEAGVLYPTIDENFYIAGVNSDSPYVHDDGDPVTTFTFDTSNYVGKVLSITCFSKASTNINRLAAGCTHSIVEGSIVDVAVTGAVNTQCITINIPITDNFVMLYVRNDYSPDAFYCTGLVLY